MVGTVYISNTNVVNMFGKAKQSLYQKPLPTITVLHEYTDYHYLKNNVSQQQN